MPFLLATSIGALLACRAGLPPEPPGADPADPDATAPTYQVQANPYETSAFAGEPAAAPGGHAGHGHMGRGDKPAGDDHAAHGHAGHGGNAGEDHSGHGHAGHGQPAVPAPTAPTGSEHAGHGSAPVAPRKPEESPR